MIAEYVYFGLRPVAVKNGSNINIVHTDYLTTPRIVTSGGSIVWQWRNDNPYGNNLAQGNIEFNLRFAGQYYDAESGLHYNIHRTYNPEIGRYMQSDPLGLSAGSNTYNYVGRNPFNGVDPLGLVEYSGTVDPVFNAVQVNYDDNWITLKMHASIGLTNSGGGLSLEENSQLYNLLKNTPTFKEKISPIKDNKGNYGVSGKSMGKMLIEAGLITKETKGILVEACNFGISTHNGNLNAQELSNITKLPVKAPTDYILFKNGKIIGSLNSFGALMFSIFGDKAYLTHITNYDKNAMNVMRDFK